MTFSLTATQHKEMDRYLARILDAYKSGAISQASAVGEIAHVITAAAIDNAGEVAAHLRMPIEELFEVE
ncbi:hypothetical protein [Xanthobacter autotrophicus]|uniref:hypothetical protein n=1 Tax=Xanthobacter autotrophicus TaxID=280 RepID=UPI003728FABE